jgi:hypothetical protein
MSLRLIKNLFVFAGLYDGILGLIFIFAPAAVFQYFDVTPPNHWAYIQFSALLLILFAAMFFKIASDPVRYRELMVYGMGLKLSYSGLVFWYQSTESIPFMWVPWAWFDLLFLILFAMAWRHTGR